MSGYRICHCGKCKITCNKHGKRAFCGNCGKRRLLGTFVDKGVVRHWCEECLKKAETVLQTQMNEQIRKICEGENEVEK